LSILMNQGWIVCINMIMVGTRCGQRFHALKSGRRQGRVNIIAALCNQNPIAPFTIEGACNRTVLETWLESCLLPTLTIGQVVVMDNATFHKGGRIRELIETAGCQLLYLPPYSPDLNLHWAMLVKVKKSNSQKTGAVWLFTRCHWRCLTSSVLTALATAISVPLVPRWSIRIQNLKFITQIIARMLHPYKYIQTMLPDMISDSLEVAFDMLRLIP
jgi:transposase